MTIRFVGIDPNTDKDECPTVWADVEAERLLIQSYEASDDDKAVCDATSPANRRPDNEPIISIPARMIPAIRKALDELDPGVQ